MFEYDRIAVSEGIGFKKTTVFVFVFFRESIICYYCYFLKINFKFQPNIFNGCYDLMQKNLSFNDAAIVIKSNIINQIFIVKYK